MKYFRISTKSPTTEFEWVLTSDTLCGYTLDMGRERRGGFIFVWFKGDHPPPHVHIFKDGKLIAKVDLVNERLLEGTWDRRIKNIISEMIREGVFHEILEKN